MSTTKILIAVSSPWASRKLAPPIADLARRLDADAVVTHVAHQRREDEHEDEASRRGEQTLKMLAQALREEGLETEEVMLFSDDIAKAILNTARNRGCHLIVMGTSRRTFMQWLLRKHVPTNLITRSDIPVLLCPPDWDGRI
ncbi:MAG: universal stress protein [Phycisphaeraceae bacterium]|nr:universal stress protein [Phycisphaeraceae bacterium]